MLTNELNYNLRLFYRISYNLIVIQKSTRHPYFINLYLKIFEEIKIITIYQSNNQLKNIVHSSCQKNIHYREFIRELNRGIVDHHTERRCVLGTIAALVKRTSNEKIQGGRMWTFLSKLLPMTVNQHFKHPRFSLRRVQGKKDEEKESKYDGERVYIQDVNIFVKHFRKVDFRGENKYEKID